MFWPGASTSVGMPTSRPSRSTRAPPLLPGLMAASVWISPSSPPTMRSTALTTPVVTVQPKPKGLPMATTCLPGTTDSSGAGSIRALTGDTVSTSARS